MNDPLTRRTRIEYWVALFCALITVFIAGCQTSDLVSKTPQHATWIESWKATNSTWRGVHLSVQSGDQAKALIEAMPRLASVGVNVIIAEVDYSFEFQSHPEVRSDRYVTKAEAQELSRAAHSYGIRLIPQLNCLGHQSWSKNTLPLLAKHPEFDETPGQFPENKGIYCRSWCPQHPEINAFVFALIDELIDAFDADAFHVGMDEVFLICSEFCPRCKNGDRAKLFAKAVNDLHGHIVGKRKVEMLMWADRLLDASKMGYSEWEASKNGTEGAVELVPHDIILCDWHYEKRDSYSSLPFFLAKGFRVWPSGWQPLESNLAFSRFALKQKDPRRLGYLCTTWGKTRIANAAEWPPIVEVLKEWK